MQMKDQELFEYFIQLEKEYSDAFAYNIGTDRWDEKRLAMYAHGPLHKIQILAYFIPVDDENSIIALRFYNKITGIKAVDKIIAWLGSRANKIIERQDRRIVATQLPKASSLRMSENLVSADMPIIEYRSKRDNMQKELNN